MSDYRYGYRASGTGSRRESDRSPNSSSASHFDGRSSASRRDPDRGSDYVTDQFRPSRSAPRDGASFQESRRPASDLYAHANANMDPERADKATSNIAKQLILLQDALAEWVQTKIKKDSVCEGLRQRLATYERHGGKHALEPSVAEAWQKQHDHLSQEEDKFNKELAQIDAKTKISANEFARLLVKELPIGEMKERHLIDAAKSELAKERKSAPAPVPVPVSPAANDDDRIQKLEKQMSSLLESQQTQQANYVKLLRENEEQRSKIALYEAQTADIAALKIQLEQLHQFQQQQDKLSNEAPWINDIETLKQENLAFKSQASESQTEFANFVKRIDSQQEDFSKSLQEATTRFKQSTATSSGPTEQVKALESQVEELHSQVKEHDKVLSNYDPEEYAATVSKLINYPDYPELDRMLNGRESELKRIGLETHGLSQKWSILSSDVSKITKRHATVEARLDVDLKKFSDQVIETCGKAIQELKDRVEHLSVQPSSEAPAAEIQRLREADSIIENEVKTLRNEARESLKAHEMMIMGLDEQFKNISTLETANIILDNMKKLPTHLVPLDTQNFHERLVDLETFREEYIRRSKQYTEAWGEDLQNLIQTKRSVVEEDDGLEQPEKR